MTPQCMHLQNNLTNFITNLIMISDCLCDWLQANKLSLNIAMFFLYGNDHPNNGFSVCIGTDKIQRKDVVKFLQIHIDNKLIWKEHIKHVNLKISRAFYILRTVKQMISCHHLKNCTVPQFNLIYFTVSLYGDLLINHI